MGTMGGDGSGPGTRRRLLGVSLALALAAGGTLTLPDEALAQAPAKPKRVVTTFTILQDMVQNVAGDKAVVESITKPGAEIHGYEPTPLDIVKAQAADLVVWNGLGLERWAEKFLQNLKEVPRIVVTAGIEPLPISEGPYGGKPNPHSWMAPANAVIYVENVRRALVGIDPANAETYDRNAAAYTAKIKALDEPVAETLGRIPADRRFLVTCEGAFSYLTKSYGLKELYLWPINAEEQGSPQQIRSVIDQVRKNKIPVTFCESTVSDKPMRQVAREAKARFGGVLYVDSLTDEKGAAPTYLKLLEYNAATILKGYDVSN